MGYVIKDLKALFYDFMTFAILYVRDEADATGIMLVQRVIKPLFRGHARIISVLFSHIIPFPDRGGLRLQGKSCNLTGSSQLHPKPNTVEKGPEGGSSGCLWAPIGLIFLLFNEKFWSGQAQGSNARLNF